MRATVIVTSTVFLCNRSHDEPRCDEASTENGGKVNKDVMKPYMNRREDIFRCFYPNVY